VNKLKTLAIATAVGCPNFWLGNCGNQLIKPD